MRFCFVQARAARGCPRQSRLHLLDHSASIRVGECGISTALAQSVIAQFDHEVCAALPPEFDDHQ